MSAGANADNPGRYFQLSLFLLVASGFATLAFTGRLDTLSLLLVCSALAVRGYALARRRHMLLPERWTSWIGLGYIGVYALDYFLVTRDFITATVHLVLFAMVVKMFSVHRDRDYLYLALLAFLQVLAASVLTIDALFLGSLSLFLLLAVNAFVSFEMRRSWALAHTRARENAQARFRMPRTLALTAALMAGGILVTGTGIFFLLPRVSAGYLSTLAPKNDIASGFSNEVNLGKIGQIQQLDTVVMHVQVQGKARIPDDLKWRGISLGLFDGKRWYNPAQDFQVLLPSSGHFSLLRRYRWNDSRSQRADWTRGLRYRVVMEQIGPFVFFLAPKAAALSGNYRAISTDAGEAFYYIDHERQINTYEALSLIGKPAAEHLRSAGSTYPAGIQLRYLQLPKRVDPRIRALAEEITAESSNAYDKAAAIESYLRINYGYTLQLPATPPQDPVADFVFERRKGHCEYFSSAMAVMLRTLGIPTRLVNGFRGGEFNPVSGSYIVRARDAHSWVEAYFPQFGWIEFDPTPPDERAAPGMMNRLMLYFDAAREFWREWIINYDFAHQRNVGSAAVARGRLAADRTRLWAKTEYESLLTRTRRLHQSVQRAPRLWAAGLIIGIALVVAVLNKRALQQALVSAQLTRHPQRSPRSSATLWYERLLKHLARRGWRKRPTQTSQEFIATIDSPEVREVVADFIAHYERARFAGSCEDAQSLPELYEEARSK